MRLVFAAVAVFSALMVGAGILFGPPHGTVRWIEIALAVSTFSAVATRACLLFDRAAWRRSLTNPSLEDMERLGLIVSTEYHAVRALQLEGSRYLLQLADGGVLYLGGQYLDLHRALEEDAGAHADPRFPCTHFTVRRDKATVRGLEIIPRGTPLQPETLPAFSSHHLALLNANLKDGDIIRDKSLDEIKAEQLKNH